MTGPDGAPAGYTLPRIPYVRLRCTLEACEPVRLPAYHGSLLRGAFGNALRRIVCAVGRHQPCGTCRLRHACLFTRLFETFIDGEPPPFLGGLETPPRPYVFEPRSDRRDFGPGDLLGFDLLLIGRAAELMGHSLLAVERMAAAGLGSRRARFKLAEAGVAAENGRNRPLVERGALVTGAKADPQWTGGGHEGEDGRLMDLGPVVLRFLSPTRLKVRGRLAAGVGFRDLAFAMLRRTVELAHFYVPGATTDWNLASLLARTTGVRITSSDLRWHDWQRYSQRQRTKMTLGGFTGGMTLEGDVAPFVPLLRTAEVLHVGKGATFGLGKVEVRLG